ncbi:hypothetical protein OFC05_31570, partial [Escherichia coli]|nr:hypothetical protein [Escherichia coli]
RRRARAQFEKDRQQTAAERVAEFMRATEPAEAKERTTVTPRKPASPANIPDVETHPPTASDAPPSPPLKTSGVQLPVSKS